VSLGLQGGTHEALPIVLAGSCKQQGEGAE